MKTDMWCNLLHATLGEPLTAAEATTPCNVGNRTWAAQLNLTETEVKASLPLRLLL